MIPTSARCATTFLESSAETSPAKNVGTSLANNVRTSPANNVRTCPDRSVETFRNRNAQTCLGKNVEMCQDSSASRCPNRCAVPANQTTDEIFTNQHVPDFTTETYDLTSIPMYLYVSNLFDIYGILVNLKALEEINECNDKRTLLCGGCPSPGFPTCTNPSSWITRVTDGCYGTTISATPLLAPNHCPCLTFTSKGRNIWLNLFCSLTMKSLIELELEVMKGVGQM